MNRHHILDTYHSVKSTFGLTDYRHNQKLQTKYSIMLNYNIMYEQK